MPRQDESPQGDGTAAAAQPTFGIGGVLIGLGLLALVAIVVFVLVSAHNNAALRTDAVTSAASSLAAAPPPPPAQPTR
jgi:hypothetical protein